MLRLENIVKHYKVADTTVEALKGVSLSFRKNEFVSILGPSGCGKTTMLNIIGGLDKYTSGDLFIRGKSTKEYTGHDWDIYRNHRVGFIFQSYNLIPHQTILGNVELALTIAGVSKAERQERAKKALDKVGLKGQYDKKPNQLSGGQCQRVAIARALVNEPEILLADEPTGALDTHTSLQIMDLIKEISKDKLVIMVTHNPELAEKYSNRIIRLLDGELQSDSNPFSKEDEIKESEEILTHEEEEKAKFEKAKMSFATSFKLSLRNLLSKKKRTILVSIAGSIGIIGVASVLAVSSGVKGYIKTLQDDMLSGNPITIEESSYDLSSVMNMLTVSQKVEVAKELASNEVDVEFLVDEVLKSYADTKSIQVSNNITKEYIDYVSSISEEYAACISLSYGVDLRYNIYTDFTDLKENPSYGLSLAAIKENYMDVLAEVEGIGDYSNYITSLSQSITQAPSNEEYIRSQYNVTGSVATKENEIMIVVDKDKALTDLTLALLGYYEQEEYINIAIEAQSEGYDYSSGHPNYKNKFTYEELLGKTFRYYSNDQVYVKDENAYNYISENTIVSAIDKAGDNVLSKLPFFNYNAYEADIANEGMELKVVGILEPKEDINYGCLSSGVYYTEALTKKAISDAKDSVINQYMVDHDTNNITTTNLSTLVASVNQTANEALYKAGAYSEIPYTGIYYKMDHYDYTNNKELKEDIITFVGSEGQTSQLMSMFESFMGGGTGISIPTSYTIYKREIGGEELANGISIYPVNFEQKDYITDYLDAWNADGDIVVNGVTYTKDERSDITYSDPVGLIITIINSLIDIVSYALIAFTALSLIVSCFMIAIITYVSVMERVKEIGVIRSLGGRKKDVSHLFNAETLIIGFTSGVLGIIGTFIIELIINLIVGSLSGIYTLASLQWYQALAMLALSVILTVISGLIPSQSAAKQDPVNALRSE